MNEPIGSIKAFYTVWNPAAASPPSRTYDTAEQARAVARSMAEKHPGEFFYVAHVEGYAYKPRYPTAEYKAL
jgi:hypothetical protein